MSDLAESHQDPLTVNALAQRVGGTVVGNGRVSGDQLIRGVGALDDATAEQVSFLANDRYARQLATTGAGVVLVSRDVEAATDGEGPTLVQVDDPSRAFVSLVSHFGPPPLLFEPGVAPSAVVHETATLGADVHVGPNAVVGAGARIGDRTILRAGAIVGQETVVGADCDIHAHVVLRERITLGDRVAIHASTVVGSDGFGYFFADGAHHKIPQVGTVEIGDDVEIGSCCTVDRGRFGATTIGAGTKIDNLVQIAHNVQIGKCVLIIAQSGVAGSTSIGDYAILAAKAGIVGHLTIGAGAQIAGNTGVTRNVEPGAKIVGFWGMERRDFLRREKNITKLPRLVDQIDALSKRIQDLEAQAADDQATG